MIYKLLFFMMIFVSLNGSDLLLPDRFAPLSTSRTNKIVQLAFTASCDQIKKVLNAQNGRAVFLSDIFAILFPTQVHRLGYTCQPDETLVDPLKKKLALFGSNKNDKTFSVLFALSQKDEKHALLYQKEDESWAHVLKDGIINSAGTYHKVKIHFQKDYEPWIKGEAQSLEFYNNLFKDYLSVSLDSAIDKPMDLFIVSAGSDFSFIKPDWIESNKFKKEHEDKREKGKKAYEKKEAEEKKAKEEKELKEQQVRQEKLQVQEKKNKIVRKKCRQLFSSSNKIEIFKNILLLENNFYDLFPDKNSWGSLCEIKDLSNRLEHFSDKHEDVVDYFKGVSINVASGVLRKCLIFLRDKQSQGNDIEKAVYNGMSLEKFIARLFVSRPLMCYTKNSKYLLHDQSEGSFPAWWMTEEFDIVSDSVSHSKSPLSFQKIGTCKEEENIQPLCLRYILSEREKFIAAFFGIASSTDFINRGHRTNSGIRERDGIYEPTGVIAGLVGTQLEIINHMFTALLLVYPSQNTIYNGYGPDNSNNPQCNFLAKFFKRDYLPTFDEVDTLMKDNDPVAKKRYLKLNAADVSKIKIKNNDYNYDSDGLKMNSEYPSRSLEDVDIYFDIELNKKFLRQVCRAFLEDADRRACAVSKKALCRLTGIGLGEWKVANEQEDYLLDVYKELLDEYDFPNIAELNFCCFSKGCKASWNSFKSKKNKHMSFSFSVFEPGMDARDIKNPADPVTKAGQLLVVQYAWDSFAIPGNEFWGNNRTGSGDPAAIAGSLAGSIHNPHINPFLKCAIIRRVNEWRVELSNKIKELESVEGKKTSKQQGKLEKYKEILKILTEDDLAKGQTKKNTYSLEKPSKESQSEKDERRKNIKLLFIGAGVVCGFALICKLLHSLNIFSYQMIFSKYWMI